MHKSFRCPGVCAGCGRCMASGPNTGAGDRKAKIIAYPDGFTADRGSGLAAAFDVGTTTIAGMLWDAEQGMQLGASVRTNPQRKHGADVISRITYCAGSPEKLRQLRSELTDCLNEMIREMCLRTGRQAADISKAAVCGNTTMSHIFAGYSPEGLALAPFTPAYEGTLRMTGRDALLDLPEGAEVTVVPGIAGHVGGDITAGILASGIMDMEGLTVFIDIGTNGEIVVADEGRLTVCSTAAGPAFEGASISCGMRAADGAIEKVSIDRGRVNISTIGNRESAGICGSGLIDAISQMLNAGLIDETGRLAAGYEWASRGFDRNLSGRLTEEDGQRQFVLACTAGGEDIAITQNDIREVQLAKGAINAGVELLLGKTGKNAGDIRRVVIGGAFGNYIDKAAAVNIGLLPAVPEEMIVSAGNTAGAGVSMAMVSRKAMELAEKIPCAAAHVELAEEPDFQEKYLASMGFRR
ncbi:MAG: ASKHA domain-containing protein [Lentihominibacter sp.]